MKNTPILITVLLSCLLGVISCKTTDSTIDPAKDFYVSYKANGKQVSIIEGGQRP
jgi:hypothetical protein